MERKQDCTCAYDLLDTLYHLELYTPILCGFVVAQTLRDFKTNTILVYIILNGRGSLTGCSLHGNSLVSLVF